MSIIPKGCAFTYSALTSYETCPLQFKYLYIDKIRERKGNFFAQYGSYIHSIIEKYFKNELEIWELLDYYVKEYSKNINLELPPYLNKSYNSYYQSGYDFFENFTIDKSDYEIIHMENFIKGIDNSISFVIKPDLIFKEKSTDDIIIISPPVRPADSSSSGSASCSASR